MTGLSNILTATCSTTARCRGRLSTVKFLGVWLFLAVTLNIPLKLCGAFQCGHCNRTSCVPPDLCTGGLVVDPCGCCKECAKVETEPCGGKFGLNGRCDDGLYCAINPEYGTDITGDEDGVCKVIPVVVPVSCEGVECGVITLPQCPDDAIISGGGILPGDCCPQPHHCQCMPCLEDGPQCGPDQLRILTDIGLGHPGRCCDTYQCLDKSNVCKDVVCEVDPFANVTCPSDSDILSPLLTQNGCCIQHAGCVCKPPDQCEIPICLPGTRPQLVEPNTGLPGRCCDHIQCVSDTALECATTEGTWRTNGEIWQLDACTQCTCDRGLTRCDQVTCPPLEQCGWISIPEGQCCHMCMGCAKGNMTYANGAEWQQDPCVTCYCDGGQVYCRAELCISDCTHPRVVPGLCCPICDDAPSISVIHPPVDCASLDNCTLAPFCPLGLKEDDRGCYQCSCKDDIIIGEVPPSCKLSCPHGYKLDEDGFEICECVSSTTSSTPKSVSDTTSVPGPTEEDSGAVTAVLPYIPHPVHCPSMTKCDKECAFGFRISKDGCPKCKCNRCPPFLCQKKCAHGYAYNDNGCVLCKCRDNSLSPAEPPTEPGPQPVPGTGTEGTCLTDDGLLREDGQSWHDNCRLCFCHQGREMCTLITCPVPRCRHPVVLQGDCCASCADEGGLSVPALPASCRANDGKHIAEGETWHIDKCTLCICHNGEMLCEVERCPPLTCQQSVRIKGHCCPICIDDEQLGPTYLPNKTPGSPCQVSPGMVVHSGDIWRVSACQSCMCRDGQIHCYSQTCPLLTKCNKTVMRKGQCCPQCIDEAPPPKVCALGAEIYASGEVWLLNNCTWCVCHDGRVLCLETQCSPLVDCASIALPTDTCCPTCKTNHSIESPGNEDSEGSAPGDSDSVPFSNFVVLLVVIIVLVVLVLVLVLVVSVLCWRKKKAKQRQQYQRTKAVHAMFQREPGHVDISRRPKSVNLEYRGHNPLAGDLSWRENRHNYAMPSQHKFQYYDETVGLLAPKSKLSDAESMSDNHQSCMEKKEFVGSEKDKNNLNAAHSMSVEDNCNIDCGSASTLTKSGTDSGTNDLMGDVDKLSEFDNAACIDSSYSDLALDKAGVAVNDNILPNRLSGVSILSSPPSSATETSIGTIDLLIGTPGSEVNHNIPPQDPPPPHTRAPPLPHTRYSVNDEVWLRNTSHDKAPMEDKCIRYSMGADAVSITPNQGKQLLGPPAMCETNSYRKSL